MSLIKTLNSLRREYSGDNFDIGNAKKSPFDQFSIWFDDAIKTKPKDPNAMALATAGTKGMPSCRYVLLKNYDDTGFVFFTNYESRKGRELEENPKASLLFYWDKLDRQIRIEGVCEKISESESDDYFSTRPYESKLGAWASAQSAPLKSRFTLLRQVAALMAKYPKSPPRPPFWGGYRLIPERFEFWQGRESRLHDRIVYDKSPSGWVLQRLHP